ncbi:hypothetical protein Pla144_36850 [Bythopirellula polymerisocia]|uniref:Uncharacterized protein n=2 Tax=Bythopirellula polymerisocia TaxID=2528003 RepID=A0A5C6CPV7_9BACT|nr:hypothetical protein Pla144_36850 [Bythopirellula polymerisocia]
MKGSGFRLPGNLIVGVIGAIVGGLVFGLLGFESNILGSLTTARVGAGLFIAFLRGVKRVGALRRESSYNGNNNLGVSFATEYAKERPQ